MSCVVIVSDRFGAPVFQLVRRQLLHYFYVLTLIWSSCFVNQGCLSWFLVPCVTSCVWFCDCFSVCWHHIVSSVPSPALIGFTCCLLTFLLYWSACVPLCDFLLLSSMSWSSPRLFFSCTSQDVCLSDLFACVWTFNLVLTLTWLHIL